MIIPGTEYKNDTTKVGLLKQKYYVFNLPTTMPVDSRGPTGHFFWYFLLSRELCIQCEFC